MVGSKGSSSTRSTRSMTGDMYSDGDGRIYVYDSRNQPYYLTSYEIKMRMSQARAFDESFRVRVRAKSVPA